MIARALLLALLGSLALPLAAADAPAGRYRCEGSNDGVNPGYACEVEVTPHGDNHRVVWRIGEAVHTGVGLMIGDRFSVAYSNGQPGHFGVAVYSRDGERWYGRWTEHQVTHTGTEVWYRE